MPTGILNVVRVRNVGTTDFIGKYNSQTYVFKAGEEGMAEYDAVCRWLGNPESRDLNNRQRDRTDEFKRIRILYGVYENEHLWEEARPKLEVYTLDGERIITVAEDPYGAAYKVTFPGQENANNAAVLAQMAQQQELIKVLIDGLDKLDPETAANARQIAGVATPTLSTVEPVSTEPVEIMDKVPAPRENRIHPVVERMDDAPTPAEPAADGPPSDGPPKASLKPVPPLAATPDTPSQPKVDA